MVCGECGATIADKAIVCYRCGAPTEKPAAAARKPAPRRGIPILGLLVVLVAFAVGWFAFEAPHGSTEHYALAAGAVVTLIAGIWLAVRRR